MSKTAEGLRDRLFDALDGLIDGTVDTKKVESICYISEQIIKTAQTELEVYREQTRRTELQNQHELSMRREEKDAIKLLGKTIDSIEVEDESFTD